MKQTQFFSEECSTRRGCRRQFTTVKGETDYKEISMYVIRMRLRLLDGKWFVERDLNNHVRKLYPTKEINRVKG